MRLSITLKAGFIFKIIASLPRGLASKTRRNDLDWLRHVAANPNMDIEAVCSEIENALAEVSSVSGKS